MIKWRVWCLAAAVVIGYSGAFRAGSAAIAQSSAAIAQSSVVPNVPAVKVDARARAILDAMIATYKDATSYSGKINMQSTGLIGVPRQHGELTLQKPNKFRVVGTNGTVTTTWVYDGNRFSYATSRFPGEYVQVTPLPERDVFAETLNNIGAEGTALALLLAGQDPLKGLARFLQTISLGDADKVTGADKDSDVIVATFARTWSTGTVTYVIGKKDHLLRRATLSQTTKGKTVTITEIHSDVQANLKAPAATFRFVPGPAAVRVAEPAPVQEPAAGNGGGP